jgi:hypothetical protein
MKIYDYKYYFKYNYSCSRTANIIIFITKIYDYKYDSKYKYSCSRTVNININIILNIIISIVILRAANKQQI